MKENTNITEVAHNEINRLESINAELLEACEEAIEWLSEPPERLKTPEELAPHYTAWFNLKKAINKAKGN